MVDLDYYGMLARYLQELAYALHLHSDLVAKEQLGLYENIELPMASVLARMEILGIALDGNNVSSSRTTMVNTWKALLRGCLFGTGARG